MGKIHFVEDLDKGRKDKAKEAFERIREHLESLFNRKFSDDEVIEFCESRKELEKIRNQREEEVQDTYAFAKKQHSEEFYIKYYEDLARAFFMNRKNRSIVAALGLVAWLQHNHPDKLPDDYDMADEKLFGHDIYPITAGLGFDIMKEKPKGFEEELQDKIEKAPHSKLDNWMGRIKKNIDNRHFDKEFEKRIKTAPSNALKEMMKQIREISSEKYINGRPPRSATVERACTRTELERFLSHVKCPIFRSAILLMAIVGLRPSELVNLKGRSVDRVNGKLIIDSLKDSHVMGIRIPQPLLEMLPKARPNESLYPFSYNGMKKRFARARKKAGLEDAYMYTRPCGTLSIHNRRFRFTLHSLRHFALQEVQDLQKDITVTKAYARHRNIHTTMTYMKKNMLPEVQNAMDHLAYDLIEGVKPSMAEPVYDLQTRH